MGRCHLTEGKQALEIRSSLSEKRALTDPIQQTLASAGSLARNLQWAKAHGTVELLLGDPTGTVGRTEGGGQEEHL